MGTLLLFKVPPFMVEYKIKKDCLQLYMKLWISEQINCIFFFINQLNFQVTVQWGNTFTPTTGPALKKTSLYPVE